MSLVSVVCYQVEVGERPIHRPEERRCVCVCVCVSECDQGQQ